MRRLPTPTLVLLTLLAAVVATLTLLALRRVGGGDAPISHQVNDLIATFEIPLQASPGTLRAIPGWATLILLAAGLAFAIRSLLQRARSNRS
jgi:hypothetical protein